MIILSFTSRFHVVSCIYIRQYVNSSFTMIQGTDENGKNWYMTNNKQYTVFKLENLSSSQGWVDF